MASVPSRSFIPFHASLPAGFVIALLILLATPVASAQPSRSLLQHLRDLLGVQRPVAVAGSRGQSTPQLCLISPWRSGDVNGIATAITPSGSPPIATRERLAEVQILRGSTLLWRRRASTSEPIQTPLAWPLDPLPVGQSVTLRLRPVLSAGGGFATIRLSREATSSTPLPDPAATGSSRWLKAIGEWKENDEPAAAVEGLLRGALEGNPTLAEQAKELIRQACARFGPA